MKTALEIPEKKSSLASLALGVALFLMLLALLVLSAGFDASKFIYVDF
jgi:hypothetical protein